MKPEMKFGTVEWPRSLLFRVAGRRAFAVLLASALVLTLFLSGCRSGNGGKPAGLVQSEETQSETAGGHSQTGGDTPDNENQQTPSTGDMGWLTYTEEAEDGRIVLRYSVPKRQDLLSVAVSQNGDRTLTHWGGMTVTWTANDWMTIGFNREATRGLTFQADPTGTWITHMPDGGQLSKSEDGVLIVELPDSVHTVYQGIAHTMEKSGAETTALEELRNANARYPYGIGRTSPEGALSYAGTVKTIPQDVNHSEERKEVQYIDSVSFSVDQDGHTILRFPNRATIRINRESTVFKIFFYGNEEQDKAEIGMKGGAVSDGAFTLTYPAPGGSDVSAFQVQSSPPESRVITVEYSNGVKTIRYANTGIVKVYYPDGTSSEVQNGLLSAIAIPNKELSEAEMDVLSSAIAQAMEISKSVPTPPPPPVLLPTGDSSVPPGMPNPGREVAFPSPIDMAASAETDNASTQEEAISPSSSGINSGLPLPAGVDRFSVWVQRALTMATFLAAALALVVVLLDRKKDHTTEIEKLRKSLQTQNDELSRRIRELEKASLNGTPVLNDEGQTHNLAAPKPSNPPAMKRQIRLGKASDADSRDGVVYLTKQEDGELMGIPADKNGESTANPSEEYPTYLTVIPWMESDGDGSELTGYISAQTLRYNSTISSCFVIYGNFQNASAFRIRVKKKAFLKRVGKSKKYALPQNKGEIEVIGIRN